MRGQSALERTQNRLTHFVVSVLLLYLPFVAFVDNCNQSKGNENHMACTMLLTRERRDFRLKRAQESVVLLKCQKHFQNATINANWRLMHLSVLFLCAILLLYAMLLFVCLFVRLRPDCLRETSRCRRLDPQALASKASFGNYNFRCWFANGKTIMSEISFYHCSEWKPTESSGRKWTTFEFWPSGRVQSS